MKKIITFLIVIALLAGGLMILKKRRQALELAKPPKPLAVRVDTIKLERRNIRLTLPVLAEVRSLNNATVSTKISGTVIEVSKQEGDRVKRGEMLARIDDRNLTTKKASLKLSLANLDFQISSKLSQIQSLRIKLENTLDTHRRTSELLKVKGASIEQFQNEETAIASLKAQINGAQNELKAVKNQKNIIKQGIREINVSLSYSLIRSPIDGIISQRFVSKGELALPGKPLFAISSRKANYLVVHLPSEIKPRSLVLKNRTLSLTPLNRADQNGLRQYTARVPEGLDLVAGEIVNGGLVIFQGESVLVPPDALLSREGKKMVFQYKNGKAVPEEAHITASGKEGVILDKSMAGKSIILAKPDILLRLLTGVPVKATMTAR
ncbi:MAG: efflux RND transporter periplasmic adaptor subunit [Deltaproteobacteria bacterium]|nr:efflux RND transporter periplasmic adaptor subunit [Deltaproteobacteria bacterium]